MESIPCQIICLKNKISFSRRIETLFDNKKESLSSVYDALTQQISKLSNVTAATSNQLQQRKEHALIIQIIHQRDVIDVLILNRCCDLSDWSWQSQLRFYIKEKSCDVMIGDALIDYSFEYQGNEESLVCTNLTDKCYLNLTQAMRFGFGGNLFGPAGTGNAPR